jgi:lauroyl-KDO2-lipid IV(A) myristoyltransferase
MARLTNAALVPVTCIYDEAQKKYKVVILEPLEGVTGDDLHLDTKKINIALEQMIRLAPEQQYLWTLRFYQSRPDGSPPPYLMEGKPGSGYRPRPNPDVTG